MASVRPPQLYRLYRLALHALPSEFRRRYGASMEQLLRDRLREEGERRGRMGLLTVWLQAAADLIRSLGREWSEQWRDRDVARRGARSELDSRVRRSRLMTGMLQDLRFAVRTLARSPGFAAVAVVTLALGIGANTAIFSVVNALLLRPLPYEDPDRLMTVWEVGERGGSIHVTTPNFLDWRETSSSFDGLAAYSSGAFGGTTTVLGGREPVRLWVTGVSSDFFRVFAMRPVVGRLAVEDEFTSGSAAVVVVSHRYWLSHLGGDPNLAAYPLAIRGTTRQVIGVAPPGFRFPSETDVWAPVSLAGQVSRTSHNWAVIGRRRDNVSAERAQAELSAITRNLKSRFGEGMDAVDARVTRLQDDLVGPVKGPLHLLLGAAAFVLLVACTNIASTLLARGTARQRELSIRVAMGAGRGRIVRQLLTESVVLSLAGAVAGVALSVIIVRGLLALAPPSLRGLEGTSVDAAAIGFAIAVSFAAALLFGLMPAFRASSTDVTEALRGGSRGNAGNTRRGPWRMLVGGEVALALVLLVGSGLLIKSFWSVLDVDPGFDPSGVVTLDISLPTSTYQTDEAVAAFYRALLAELHQIPSVTHAGLINHLPLSGVRINGQFELEGRDDAGYADYRIVSGGYFDAMRIPLIRGRVFDEGDQAGAPHVLIINQAAAERFWPGEDPVGRRVSNLANDSWIYPDRWLTIVGVVGNVHHRSLTAAPPPELYVHVMQRPARATASIVAVRADGPLAPVIARARDGLRQLDPDVAPEFSSMSATVATSVADRRFTVLVLGAFGAVALILATVGIYGVVSYTVAQRTREMGIRLALGANPGRVRRMVQRDAMTIVVAGAVIGIAGAVGLTRLLRNLLFEVSATDPVTFGVVALGLLGAAWLASYVPARRSTRIDPMIAMRTD